MKNIFIIIIVVMVGAGVFRFVTVAEKDDEASKLSVTKEAGEQTPAAAMPENMPENVPMYPGAVLAKVDESQNDSERNINLSLVVEAVLDDVNTWYRGALKENNWSVTDDKVVGGYVLLKGENNNITTFVQSANHTESGKVIITQRIRIR